jgi:hypothetical protein
MRKTLNPALIIGATLLAGCATPQAPTRLEAVTHAKCDAQGRFAQAVMMGRYGGRTEARALALSRQSTPNASPEDISWFLETITYAYSQEWKPTPAAQQADAATFGWAAKEACLITAGLK